MRISYALVLVAPTERNLLLFDKQYVGLNFV